MNKKRSPGSVLITGAAKRLGRAMALSLASRGYSIALHYNKSETEAQSLARAVRKKRVRCELFKCNLFDEKETLALVVRVATKFPDLNLLINNASIFQPSQFHRDDLKFLVSHWNIHVKTPFILTSEFARICKKGMVINILYASIDRNKTSYVGYLLSKKTLADMTQLAAVQLAPNVRVNGIAPGYILPPEGKSIRDLKTRIKKIPLERKGNEAAITQSLEFLMDNDFLTGQIVFADGGEHLV